MDTDLPKDFLDKCSPEEAKHAIDWWNSLSRGEQKEVRVLLDRRSDLIAYVYVESSDGDSTWQVVPIVDERLPVEDRDYGDSQWRLDYFQHLLDHDELMLDNESVVRTFHICTDHSSAIEVAESGVIDNTFHCSVQSPTCPIACFANSIRSGRMIGYDRNTRLSVWLVQRTCDEN